MIARATLLSLWITAAYADPAAVPAGEAAPVTPAGEVAPAEAAPNGAAEAPPAATAPSGAAPAANDSLPPPENPPPPADQVEDLTVAYSKRLRCPVCQGMSVADSPSESAVTMKGRIRELVAAGYSEAQIQAYFIGRYGEWVLLEPPAVGVNRLLWWIPGGAALLCVGAALALARAGSRGGATPSTAPGAGPTTEDAAVAADPHRARLLRELED